MSNKGQSRKSSLLEAAINVAIGYCIAVASQAVIFPLFDIHVSTGQSMQIALAFTGVSIARSYLLRRLFNWVQLQKEGRNLRQGEKRQTT